MIARVGYDLHISRAFVAFDSELYPMTMLAAALEAGAADDRNQPV